MDGNTSSYRPTFLPTFTIGTNVTFGANTKKIGWLYKAALNLFL